MNNLAPNEFQCAICGDVHQKGWSDEEAVAEREEVFGTEFKDEDCAILCDDCYKIVMGEIKVQ